MLSVVADGATSATERLLHRAQALLRPVSRTPYGTFRHTSAVEGSRPEGDRLTATQHRGHPTRRWTGRRAKPRFVWPRGSRHPVKGAWLDVARRLPIDAEFRGA